ncbi:MAG: copper chaperone PCu(A)C [Rhodospirillales bacterium]
MLLKTLLAPAVLAAVVLAHPVAAAEITVQEPFARASAGMAEAGAAFMQLSNASAVNDQLVAASTPVAARAELHSHIKEDDIMRMRQVPSIEVPAGGTVALQPGGLHIMLIGLKQPLRQGETFPLTLTFARAGVVTVEVPVKSVGEMAPMPGMKH